jgi:hypothetical protein
VGLQEGRAWTCSSSIRGSAQAGQNCGAALTMLMNPNNTPCRLEPRGPADCGNKVRTASVLSKDRPGAGIHPQESLRGTGNVWGFHRQGHPPTYSRRDVLQSFVVSWPWFYLPAKLQTLRPSTVLWSSFESPRTWCQGRRKE